MKTKPLSESTRPKFRSINASQQMLADLREDAPTMRLSNAYSNNQRMNFAFAFGYKFSGYANGMSTWEMDAAKFGHEARKLEASP
jgi:hypothetical protein